MIGWGHIASIRAALVCWTGDHLIDVQLGCVGAATIYDERGFASTSTVPSSGNAKRRRVTGTGRIRRALGALRRGPLKAETATLRRSVEQSRRTGGARVANPASHRSETPGKGSLGLSLQPAKKSLLPFSAALSSRAPSHPLQQTVRVEALVRRIHSFSFRSQYVEPSDMRQLHRQVGCSTHPNNNLRRGRLAESEIALDASGNNVCRLLNIKWRSVRRLAQSAAAFQLANHFPSTPSFSTPSTAARFPPASALPSCSFSHLDSSHGHHLRPPFRPAFPQSSALPVALLAHKSDLSASRAASPTPPASNHHRKQRSKPCLTPGKSSVRRLASIPFPCKPSSSAPVPAKGASRKNIHFGRAGHHSRVVVRQSLERLLPRLLLTGFSPYHSRRILEASLVSLEEADKAHPLRPSLRPLSKPYCVTGKSSSPPMLSALSHQWPLFRGSAPYLSHPALCYSLLCQTTVLSFHGAGRAIILVFSCV